jgi:hypothetical protein
MRVASYSTNAEECAELRIITGPRFCSVGSQPAPSPLHRVDDDALDRLWPHVVEDGRAVRGIVSTVMWMY